MARANTLKNVARESQAASAPAFNIAVIEDEFGPAKNAKYFFSFLTAMSGEISTGNRNDAIKKSVRHAGMDRRHPGPQDASGISI